MRATSSTYTTRHLTQSKRRFNKWIKMRNRHLKKVRHWMARARIREDARWLRAQFHHHEISLTYDTTI